jgi:hypothetical protein
MVYQKKHKFVFAFSTGQYKGLTRQKCKYKGLTRRRNRPKTAQKQPFFTKFQPFRLKTSTFSLLHFLTVSLASACIPHNPPENAAPVSGPRGPRRQVFVAGVEIRRPRRQLFVAEVGIGCPEGHPGHPRPFSAFIFGLARGL